MALMTQAPYEQAQPIPPGAGYRIHEVVTRVMTELGNPAVDSDNTYHKSRYLSLAGLLDFVRQPLANAGVSISSRFCVTEHGNWFVETTLQYGDDYSASRFPVGDPSNPQKVAAAGTYGIRCNLMQLLALAPTDDDDDGGYGAGLLPAAGAVDPLTGRPVAPPPPQQWPAPGQQVQAPPATYPPQPPQAPPAPPQAPPGPPPAYPSAPHLQQPPAPPQAPPQTGPGPGPAPSPYL